MNYRIIFKNKGKKDYKKMDSKPSALRKKTLEILKQLQMDPFLPYGGFENLSIISPDCYSRKSSRGDRIVYLVNIAMHTVTIISLFGHYCDNGGRLCV